MNLIHKHFTHTLALFCALLPTIVFGGNETVKKESVYIDSKVFKPIVAFQTYATYSMNEDKFGDDYANHLDVEFRRMRFGASGSPYERLKYSFQLSLDRLGEDSYSAIKGSYSGISVWNAFLSYQILKENSLLNLHAGYFWAATSREFNTSPWAVGSFDKVRATWYLRQFSTGKGNGIESGIGLGGLKNFDNWGINYRIGTYETDAYCSSKFSNRLYTARIAFSIGDPEQTKYNYMLCGNQWRKRNGVTVGFGGSSQNDGLLNATSDLYFDKSLTYGADILIDYEGLRIDGEYFLMKRTAAGFNDYSGNEWHVRVGYTMPFKGKLLEPAITYDAYDAKGNASLFKYIGYDRTLDVGLNYYLNRDKLKLTAHYVIQNGTVNSNTGDYLGLSCIYRL